MLRKELQKGRVIKLAQKSSKIIKNLLITKLNLTTNNHKLSMSILKKYL